MSYDDYESSDNFSRPRANTNSAHINHPSASTTFSTNKVAKNNQAAAAAGFLDDKSNELQLIGGDMKLQGSSSSTYSSSSSSYSSSDHEDVGGSMGQFVLNVDFAPPKQVFDSGEVVAGGSGNFQVPQILTDWTKLSGSSHLIELSLCLKQEQKSATTSGWLEPEVADQPNIGRNPLSLSLPNSDELKKGTSGIACDNNNNKRPIILNRPESLADCGQRRDLKIIEDDEEKVERNKMRLVYERIDRFSLEVPIGEFKTAENSYSPSIMMNDHQETDNNNNNNIGLKPIILPFKSNSFDACFCFNLLNIRFVTSKSGQQPNNHKEWLKAEHLTRELRLALLLELRRVVRAKGKIMVTVFAYECQRQNHHETSVEEAEAAASVGSNNKSVGESKHKQELGKRMMSKRIRARRRRSSLDNKELRRSHLSSKHRPEESSSLVEKQEAEAEAEAEAEDDDEDREKDVCEEEENGLFPTNRLKKPQDIGALKRDLDDDVESMDQKNENENENENEDKEEEEMEDSCCPRCRLEWISARNSDARGNKPTSSALNYHHENKSISLSSSSSSLDKYEEKLNRLLTNERQQQQQQSIKVNCLRATSSIEASAAINEKSIITCDSVHEMNDKDLLNIGKKQPEEKRSFWQNPPSSSSILSRRYSSALWRAVSGSGSASVGGGSLSDLSASSIPTKSQQQETGSGSGSSANLLLNQLNRDLISEAARRLGRRLSSGGSSLLGRLFSVPESQQPPPTREPEPEVDRSAIRRNEAPSMTESSIDMRDSSSINRNQLIQCDIRLEKSLVPEPEVAMENTEDELLDAKKDNFLRTDVMNLFCDDDFARRHRQSIAVQTFFTRSIEVDADEEEEEEEEEELNNSDGGPKAPEVDNAESLNLELNNDQGREQSINKEWQSVDYEPHPPDVAGNDPMRCIDSNNNNTNYDYDEDSTTSGWTPPTSQGLESMASSGGNGLAAASAAAAATTHNNGAAYKSSSRSNPATNTNYAPPHSRQQNWIASGFSSAPAATSTAFAGGGGISRSDQTNMKRSSGSSSGNTTVTTAYTTTTEDDYDNNNNKAKCDYSPSAKAALLANKAATSAANNSGTNDEFNVNRRPHDDDDKEEEEFVVGEEKQLSGCGSDRNKSKKKRRSKQRQPNSSQATSGSHQPLVSDQVEASGNYLKETPFAVAANAAAAAEDQDRNEQLDKESHLLEALREVDQGLNEQVASTNNDNIKLDRINSDFSSFTLNTTNNSAPRATSFSNSFRGQTAGNNPLWAHKKLLKRNKYAVATAATTSNIRGHLEDDKLHRVTGCTSDETEQQEKQVVQGQRRAFSETEVYGAGFVSFGGNILSANQQHLKSGGGGGNRMLSHLLGFGESSGLGIDNNNQIISGRQIKSAEQTSYNTLASSSSISSAHPINLQHHHHHYRATDCFNGLNRKELLAHSIPTTSSTTGTTSSDCFGSGGGAATGRHHNSLTNLMDSKQTVGQQAYMPLNEQQQQQQQQQQIYQPLDCQKLKGGLVMGSGGGGKSSAVAKYQQQQWRNSNTFSSSLNSDISTSGPKDTTEKDSSRRTSTLSGISSIYQQEISLGLATPHSSYATGAGNSTPSNSQNQACCSNMGSIPELASTAPDQAGSGSMLKDSCYTQETTGLNLLGCMDMESSSIQRTFVKASDATTTSRQLPGCILGAEEEEKGSQLDTEQGGKFHSADMMKRNLKFEQQKGRGVEVKEIVGLGEHRVNQRSNGAQTLNHKKAEKFSAEQEDNSNDNHQSELPASQETGAGAGGQSSSPINLQRVAQSLRSQLRERITTTMRPLNSFMGSLNINSPVFEDSPSEFSNRNDDDDDDGGGGGGVTQQDTGGGNGGGQLLFTSRGGFEFPPQTTHHKKTGSAGQSNNNHHHSQPNTPNMRHNAPMPPTTPASFRSFFRSTSSAAFQAFASSFQQQQQQHQSSSTSTPTGTTVLTQHFSTGSTLSQQFAASGGSLSSDRDVFDSPAAMAPFGGVDFQAAESRQYPTTSTANINNNNNNAAKLLQAGGQQKDSTSSASSSFPNTPAASVASGYGSGAMRSPLSPISVTSTRFFARIRDKFSLSPTAAAAAVSQQTIATTRPTSSLSNSTSTSLTTTVLANNRHYQQQQQPKNQCSLQQSQQNNNNEGSSSSQKDPLAAVSGTAGGLAPKAEAKDNNPAAAASFESGNDDGSDSDGGGEEDRNLLRDSSSLKDSLQDEGGINSSSAASRKEEADSSTNDMVENENENTNNFSVALKKKMKRRKKKNRKLELDSLDAADDMRKSAATNLGTTESYCNTGDAETATATGAAEGEEEGEDYYYNRVVSSRRPSFQRQLDEQVNQVYRMAVERKLQQNMSATTLNSGEYQQQQLVNHQPTEYCSPLPLQSKPFPSGQVQRPLPVHQQHLSNQPNVGSDLNSIITSVNSSFNNQNLANYLAGGITQSAQVAQQQQHQQQSESGSSIYLTQSQQTYSASNAQAEPVITLRQQQQPYYTNYIRDHPINNMNIDHRQWIDSSQQSIESSSSARSLRSCWFSMPELYAMNRDSSSQSPSGINNQPSTNIMMDNDIDDSPSMDQFLEGLTSKLGLVGNLPSGPEVSGQKQQVDWPLNQLYKQVTSDGQNWSLSDLNLTSDDIAPPQLVPVAPNSAVFVGTNQTGDRKQPLTGPNYQMIKCSTLDDSVCASMKSNEPADLINHQQEVGAISEQEEGGGKLESATTTNNTQSRPTSQNSTISSTSCALSDFNSSELQEIRSPMSQQQQQQQQHWTTTTTCTGESTASVSPINVSPISNDIQTGELINPISPVPQCMITHTEVEPAAVSTTATAVPAAGTTTTTTATINLLPQQTATSTTLAPQQSKQRAMSLVPMNLERSQLTPATTPQSGCNSPVNIGGGKQQTLGILNPTNRRRSAMGNLLPSSDVAPAAITLDLRLAARKNRVKLTDLHPITFMNDHKFLNSMSSLKKAGNNKLDAIFNSPVGRRLSAVNATEIAAQQQQQQPQTRANGLNGSPTIIGNNNNNNNNKSGGIKIGLTGYVYFDRDNQRFSGLTNSNHMDWINKRQQDFRRRPSLAPNFWRQTDNTTQLANSKLSPMTNINGDGDGDEASKSIILNNNKTMNLRDKSFLLQPEAGGPGPITRPRAASCTPTSMLLNTDLSTICQGASERAEAGRVLLSSPSPSPTPQSQSQSQSVGSNGEVVKSSTTTTTSALKSPVYKSTSTLNATPLQCRQVASPIKPPSGYNLDRRRSTMAMLERLSESSIELEEALPLFPTSGSHTAETGGGSATAVNQSLLTGGGNSLVGSGETIVNRPSRRSISSLLKIGEDEELRADNLRADSIDRLSNFLKQSKQQHSSPSSSSDEHQGKRRSQVGGQVKKSIRSTSEEEEEDEEGEEDEEEEEEEEADEEEDNEEDVVNRRVQDDDSSSSDDGDIDKLVAQYSVVGDPQLDLIREHKCSRHNFNNNSTSHQLDKNRIRSKSSSAPNATYIKQQCYFGGDQIVKNDTILRQLLLATNVASLESSGKMVHHRHPEMRRFSAINLYQRDEDVFVANSMKRPPASQMQVLSTLPLLAGTLPILVPVNKQQQTSSSSSSSAAAGRNQLPILPGSRAGVKSIITGNSGLNMRMSATTSKPQEMEIADKQSLQRAGSISSALVAEVDVEEQLNRLRQQEKRSMAFSGTSNNNKITCSSKQQAGKERDNWRSQEMTEEEEEEDGGCNLGEVEVPSNLTIPAILQPPECSEAQKQATKIIAQHEEEQRQLQQQIECDRRVGELVDNLPVNSNSNPLPAAVNSNNRSINSSISPLKIYPSTSPKSLLLSPIKSPPHSPTNLVGSVSVGSAPSSPPGALLIGGRSDLYSGSKSCEPFKQLDTIIEGRGLLLGAEQQANPEYANCLRRLSGNHSRRSSLGNGSQQSATSGGGGGGRDNDDDWCKCDTSPSRRRNSSLTSKQKFLLSSSTSGNQDNQEARQVSVQVTDTNSNAQQPPAITLASTVNNTTSSISSSSKYVFDTVRSLARRTLNNFTTISNGSGSGSSINSNSGSNSKQFTSGVKTSKLLSNGSLISSDGKNDKHCNQAPRQQRSSSMFVTSSRNFEQISNLERNESASDTLNNYQPPTIPSRLLREKVRLNGAEKKLSLKIRTTRNTANEDDEDEEENVSTSSSITGSCDDSSLISLDDAEDYRTKNKENKMKHGRSLESSSSSSSSTSSLSTSSATISAILEELDAKRDGSPITADKLAKESTLTIEGMNGAKKVPNESEAVKESEEEEEEEVEQPKICYKCNKKIRMESFFYEDENHHQEEEEDDDEDYEDTEYYDDEEEEEEYYDKEEDDDEMEEDYEETQPEVGSTRTGVVVATAAAAAVGNKSGVCKTKLKHQASSTNRGHRSNQAIRTHHGNNNSSGGCNSSNGRRRNSTAARRSASMNATEQEIVSTATTTTTSGQHINRRKNKWHIQRNLAPKLKRQRSFSANYAPEVPNPMMPPPRRFSAAPTLTCPHRNKSSSHSSSSLHQTYSIDSSESMITVIPSNRGQEFKRTSRGSLSCNSGQGLDSSGSFYALPRSPLSPRSPSRCSPGLLTPNTSEPPTALEPPFSPAAITNTTCCNSSGQQTTTVLAQQQQRTSPTTPQQAGKFAPAEYNQDFGSPSKVPDLTLASNDDVGQFDYSRGDIKGAKNGVVMRAADQENFNMMNKSEGALVIRETINDLCARHTKEELEFLIGQIEYLRISDCYFSEKSSTLCMVIEIKER